MNSRIVGGGSLPWKTKANINESYWDPGDAVMQIRGFAIGASPTTEACIGD
jgi:hypothetical protein